MSHSRGLRICGLFLERGRGKRWLERDTVSSSLKYFALKKASVSTVSGAFFLLAGAGPLTTHPPIHLSHWRPTYLSLSHLIISLCSSFSLFLHLFLLLDESHFTFIFMRMVSHFFCSAIMKRIWHRHFKSYLHTSDFFYLLALLSSIIILFFSLPMGAHFYSFVTFL